MKAWQKLSTILNIGYSREMVAEICKVQSRCPAAIEAKYHLIGDKPMQRFCGHGCSVACVDEYMELAVKRSGGLKEGVYEPDTRQASIDKPSRHHGSLQCQHERAL